MKDIFLKGKNEDYFFREGNILHNLISSGKFSTVYKGQRSSDNSFVVIKKLNRQLSSDRRVVQRFQQESAFNIDSPYLVKILEYVNDEENHYIISEFINGFNLKQICNSKVLKKQANPRFFLKAISGVLEALNYLHSREIFHRDIKPSNIMVEIPYGIEEIGYGDPVVKLIDLGQFAIERNENTKVEPFSLIYSPPEQVLNISSIINNTSDIYSTGITLFELIAGHPPFTEGNPMKLMALQIAAEIPPDEKIDKNLFYIIKKATYKYRLRKPPHYYKFNELVGYLKEGQANRYKDAMEFKKAIEEYMGEGRI